MHVDIPPDLARLDPMLDTGNREHQRGLRIYANMVSAATVVNVLTAMERAMLPAAAQYCKQLVMREATATKILVRDGGWEWDANAWFHDLAEQHNRHLRVQTPPATPRERSLEAGVLAYMDYMIETGVGCATCGRPAIGARVNPATRLPQGFYCATHMQGEDAD